MKKSFIKKKELFWIMEIIDKSYHFCHTIHNQSSLNFDITTISLSDQLKDLTEFYLTFKIHSILKQKNKNDSLEHFKIVVNKVDFVVIEQIKLILNLHSWEIESSKIKKGWLDINLYFINAKSSLKKSNI